jgi:hypothetical protein
LDGIIIDWSDEDENASDSICVNREFNWNEIDENDLQHEKQNEQRISTLDGITIDWHVEYENVDDSIRVNREFDSRAMNESDLQHEKQPEQLISRWRGT